VLIPVYENYRGYQPPPYARSAILRLLSTLPAGYLAGLQSVVLTNAIAIGGGKTGRVKGKKHFRNRCLGFYHPRWKGEQPWIEIVVDNVIADFFRPGLPPIMSRIPILQNIALGDTLYHEIGHHLDHILGAPAPSGEAAAEAWTGRLLAMYFRKRYWYLIPLLPVAKAVVGALHSASMKK
jgi:hypothetical protein